MHLFAVVARPGVVNLPNYTFSHNETRTMLGWKISYKSLYFVTSSLTFVPLFTGKRERPIAAPILNLGYTKKPVPTTPL